MTSAPAKEAGLLPCPCYRCAFEAHGDEPLSFSMQRMFTCATCGNKRCPHATDHRLTCTGSNDPGQEGSSYGVPLAAPWNTRAPSPSPDQPAGEGWGVLIDLDLIRRDFESRIRWFKHRNKAEPGDDDRLDDPFDLTCANVKARIEIIDQAAALIRDLTARAEAAEGALRPFATVGALIDRYFADRPDDVVFRSGAGWTDADGKSRTLTLGHFRRALCVLAALAAEAKDGRAG